MQDMSQEVSDFQLSGVVTSIRITSDCFLHDPGSASAHWSAQEPSFTKSEVRVPSNVEIEFVITSKPNNIMTVTYDFINPLHENITVRKYAPTSRGTIKIIRSHPSPLPSVWCRKSSRGAFFDAFRHATVVEQTSMDMEKQSTTTDKDMALNIQAILLDMLTMIISRSVNGFRCPRLRGYARRQRSSGCRVNCQSILYS